METEVKKIYADVNGIVTFVCQTCGHIEKDQASKYKDRKGPVHIQCKCGTAYYAEVEFRKFYRKKTNLQGVYASVKLANGWQKIIIKNLSLEGCQFQAVNLFDLIPGDEIKIEFRLDDVKKSLIRKKAVIRSVNNFSVGCKFKELPGTFDPDLGFYLRKP